MTTTWGEFARAEPDLAAFVKARLEARPSYLATVRATGTPRVHPVTPIVTDDVGSGGEAWVSGTGHPLDDPATRAAVAAAASDDPAEAGCSGYDDVDLPERRRWKSPAPEAR